MRGRLLAGYAAKCRLPPRQGSAHSLQRCEPSPCPNLRLLTASPFPGDQGSFSCLSAAWPRSAAACLPLKALKVPGYPPQSRTAFCARFSSPAHHRSKWPDVPGLYPPTPLSDLIASIHPAPPRSLQDRLNPTLVRLSAIYIFALYPSASRTRISNLMSL